ncbi:MAG: protein translocase subunit SecF [Chromatiales bacterium]
MKFFNKVYRFNFMRYRRFWLGFSAVTSLLAVIAIAALVLTGRFPFGIDFTRGTLIELGYSEPTETEVVRDALNQAGFGGAIVQHFGTAKDILLRLPQEMGPETSNKVLAALKEGGHQVELRRVEFVGPQVGRQLAENATLAMIGALIGILIYVMLRFETKLALAAVIATLHDTILTAGFFLLTPWDFDLTVLAALLTVIGYSINDTIVVFDRIRENFRKMRTAGALEVVNTSVNETLSRTLMTGTTTAMVLTAFCIFGGEINRPFAVTVLLGLVIGTYSSIYIASPVAVALGVDRKALMPVQKEGVGADSRA